MDNKKHDSKREDKIDVFKSNNDKIKNIDLKEARKYKTHKNDEIDLNQLDQADKRISRNKCDDKNYFRNFPIDDRRHKSDGYKTCPNYLSKISRDHSPRKNFDYEKFLDNRKILINDGEKKLKNRITNEAEREYSKSKLKSDDYYYKSEGTEYSKDNKKNNDFTQFGYKSKIDFNDEKDKLVEIDEQLDFMSERFDAGLVLKLPEHKINLPIPDAKIFDNLNAYALKSFPSKKQLTVAQTDLDLLRKQQEIKERMKEKFAEMNSLNSKRKIDRRATPKTVLTLMDDNKNLGRFLNKRLRIFMRRRRKSKHPCEQYVCLFGQLLFFDRHWNLILSDVCETMQFVRQISDKAENDTILKSFEESNMLCLDKINTQKNKTNDESSLSTGLISSIDNRRLFIGKHLELKNSTKIMIRERHFTRLFIRGDSIIYISKV